MSQGPAIILPADPDYIVQERPDAAIPPDMLAELCRLARVAHYVPWRIELGKYSGNDWLVASLGYADGRDGEPGRDVFLTTDHVHASELTTDARDDAEWCVAVRKLLPQLVNLLVEKLGRKPKPPGEAPCLDQ